MAWESQLDSKSARELIYEYARGVELYGMRDRVISRLNDRHYTAAAVYCNEAAELAMAQANQAATGKEKDLHSRNYAELRRLESMIRDME